MFFLYIIVVWALSPAAVIFCRRLRQKDEAGYLHLDFFVAGEILFFIGLHLFYFAENPMILPSDWAFVNFLFLLFLDSICFFVGYSYGSRRELICHSQISPSRAVFFAYVFSFICLYASLKLPEVAMDHTVNQQYTGLAAFYTFLQSWGIYGLIFALIVMFKYRKTVLVLPVILLQMILLGQKLLDVRRSAFALTFFIVAGVFYIYRKIKIPLPALIGGGILLIFIVFVGGQIRGSVRDSSMSWSERIAAAQEKADFQAENTSVDTLNGIYYADMTSHTLFFDGGAPLWNMFTFFYVPNFILGQGFKQSIMIPVNSWDVRLEQEGRRAFDLGTCPTGIAEAYGSFWYFGSIIYLLLGYWGGRLYQGAVRKQNDIYVFFYLSIGIVFTRFFGNNLWGLLAQNLGVLIMMGGIFWLISQKEETDPSSGVDHE